MKLEECDLVMKGGITSGVVYPPLVLQLKNRYRFRCIGGTSAGAIAAALTAAAEYRRQNGGGDAGFEELGRVQEYVSTGTNLRDLFQPTRNTRPLMQLALDLMAENKAHGSLGRALWRKAVGILLLPLAVGLLCGVAVWGLSVWRLGIGPVASGVLAVLCVAAGLLAGLAGGIVPIGWPLLRAYRAVVGKGFGLCPGNTDLSGKARDSALSVWLGRKLNACAGLPERPDPNAPHSWTPLTFGQLWGNPDGTKKQKRRERDIQLQLVSSNLSQGLGYLLPFDEGERFIFHKEDFLDYFDGAVVDFLTRQPEAQDPQLPSGYYYLPPPERLPVIVAVRMSLSFPVLFTAVRLWTHRASVDEQKVSVEDLQENWFSDGGVCSNFPIHFFDGWLPRRPTFGVNLTGFPPEALKGGVLDPAHQSRVAERRSGPTRTGPVYLPKPEENLFPQWLPISGLPGFLMSIVNTAKDCRDNAQSLLPSYRERIVQVRFNKEEGGLNLTMDPQIVRRIVQHGAEAGGLLLQYADASTGRMRQHQWVRFRVLMKQLENALRKLHEVLADRNPGAFNLSELFQQQRANGFPFPIELEIHCAELLNRIDEMGKLIAEWEPKPNFETGAPVPDPMLRVVPRL